jgi:hypothetical protein
MVPAEFVNSEIRRWWLRDTRERYHVAAIAGQDRK